MAKGITELQCLEVMETAQEEGQNLVEKMLVDLNRREGSPSPKLSLGHYLNMRPRPRAREQ